MTHAHLSNLESVFSFRTPNMDDLTAKAINRLEDRCDHEIRHRADE